MKSARQRRGEKAYAAGLWAEGVASLYFTLKGYRILARRMKTAQGEIDLVVRRGQTVAFVEVKDRPSLEAAAGAILPRQQERLRRAAACFLAGSPQLGQCTLRFDAFWVAGIWRVQHIPSAWDF